MIGDKLVITDYHRQSAAKIFNTVREALTAAKLPFVVTIAGESGSGKSEVAAVFAELCEASGFKALILQQDDYFFYPPKTNHNRRLDDLSWVGMQEVNLSLIEEHIEKIKAGESSLTKPLVNYEADQIGEETVSVKGLKVVVVEGTYTTTVANADFRAFINRNYRQTKKARLARSRDPLTGFLEQVLAIEHKIIAAHKAEANLVIDPPEEEREQAHPEQ
jgi:uridine kinase